MEKLYTVRKKRPGADCGSDHELPISKLRFKLKKVGKTTSHSYMTQTSYDHRVKVDSLEKILMLGGIWGRRRRGQQRMR